MAISYAVYSRERIINLAMYLASRSGSVVRKGDIRRDVEGYSTDSSDEAFDRMLEHDKDNLRSFGFVIATVDGDGYRLDTDASFASQVDLGPEEAAAIRVAGNLALSDATFPAPDDLRLALAKIAGALGGADRYLPPSASSGSNPDDTMSLVQTSVDGCKSLGFSYVDAQGNTSERSVHPYGSFRFSGSWYVVAFDPSRGDVRVFNVDRMSDVSVNTKRPKHPDFERPDDFDVRAYMGLPFQYGTESYVARIRFDPEQGWRARRLCADHGSIEECADGSAVWTVDVRNTPRLLRWIVTHGPGIVPEAPEMLVEALRTGIRKAADIHG